jgi:hypothetical protein
VFRISRLHNNLTVCQINKPDTDTDTDMDTDKTKIEKLRGSENWATWKFQLQILLDAKDALEVVTGDMTDPGEPAAGIRGAELGTHNEARAAYRKANKRAKELIVTTVEKKPLQLLVTCNDAKAMWDKLHGVYEQKSETSISTVQTQFYQYVKDESDDIATHISKVENIAERLRQLGEPIPDSMVMTKILNTLPSPFSHFASAWDSTLKAERTRDNLTARLLTEELRLKPSSSSSADESSCVALSTKASWKPWKQQSEPRGNGGYGSDVICYNCQRKGHISRNCPKPRKLTQQKQENEKGEGHSTNYAFLATLGNNDGDMWYVDTGATDHMAKYFEYFADHTRFDTPLEVQVGNNQYIYAKGRGTVNVSCMVNGQWHDSHMKNVLYVPDIAHNLFSVSSATNKGLMFQASMGKCKLMKGRKVLAVGEKVDKLYKLLMRVRMPRNSMASCGQGNKRRVNQSSRGACSLMAVAVTAGEEQRESKRMACDKQNRQWSTQRKKKMTAAGDQVHIDLCDQRSTSDKTRIKSANRLHVMGMSSFVHVPVKKRYIEDRQAGDSVLVDGHVDSENKSSSSRHLVPKHKEAVESQNVTFLGESLRAIDQECVSMTTAMLDLKVGELRVQRDRTCQQEAVKTRRFESLNSGSVCSEQPVWLSKKAVVLSAKCENIRRCTDVKRYGTRETARTRC